MIHLTNEAVQVKNKDSFGQFESGPSQTPNLISPLPTIKLFPLSTTFNQSSVPAIIIAFLHVPRLQVLNLSPRICLDSVLFGSTPEPPMKINILDKINTIASCFGASADSRSEQESTGQQSHSEKNLNKVDNLKDRLSSDDGGAFTDDSDTEEFLRAHRLKELQKKTQMKRRTNITGQIGAIGTAPTGKTEKSEYSTNSSLKPAELAQTQQGPEKSSSYTAPLKFASSSSQSNLAHSQKKASIEVNHADFESDGEDLDDYGPDGYHPVYLGEKFKAGRYTVLQKLGWGHFSTVWLTEDNLYPRKDVNPPAAHQYVALKIQRSKANHSEAALDEIKLLKSLKESRKRPAWHSEKAFLKEKGLNIGDHESFCVEVLDHFPHYGPHGKHYCATFELLGPSLLEVMKFFSEKYQQGIPIWITKKIAQQVLVGLHFAHVHGQIIHTDLKPENVMIQIPEGHLKQAVELLKQRAKRPTSEKYLIMKNMLHLPPKTENPSMDSSTKTLVVSGVYEEDTSNEINQSMLGKRSMVETSQNQSEQWDLHNDTMRSGIVVSGGKSVSNFETDDSKGYLDSNTTLGAEKLEDGVQLESEYKSSRSFRFLWKEQVTLPIDENIKIKIVDFGNGCWVHKHFTPNIQTREYRSPEAIVGHEYYPNTDIWSAACMFYELLTTHYLFRPDTPENSPEKAEQPESVSEKLMSLLNVNGMVPSAPRKQKVRYPRDEIHLSLFISTLGPLPDRLWRGGAHSAELFSSKGKLKHETPVPSPYSISQQLLAEYDLPQRVADSIESALRPMLAYLPRDRVDGWTALQHPWWWAVEDGCSPADLPRLPPSQHYSEPQTAVASKSVKDPKPQVVETQDAQSLNGFASSSSRKKAALRVVNSSESEDGDIVLPEHYR